MRLVDEAGSLPRSEVEALVKALTRVELEGVAEERAAQGVCGSVVCSNAVRARSGAADERATVAWRGRRVSAETFAHFCSGECFEAFEKVLSTRELTWAVDATAAPAFQQQSQSAAPAPKPTAQATGLVKPIKERAPGEKRKPVAVAAPVAAAAAPPPAPKPEPKPTPTTTNENAKETKKTVTFADVLERPHAATSNPNPPDDEDFEKGAEWVMEVVRGAHEDPEWAAEDDNDSNADEGDRGYPDDDGGYGRDDEDRNNNQSDSFVDFLDMSFSRPDMLSSVSSFAVTWDTLTRWTTEKTKALFTPHGKVVSSYDTEEQNGEALDEETRAWLEERRAQVETRLQSASKRFVESNQAKAARMRLSEVCLTLDLSRDVPVLGEAHWEALAFAFLLASVRASRLPPAALAVSSFAELPTSDAKLTREEGEFVLRALLP